MYANLEVELSKDSLKGPAKMQLGRESPDVIG